MTRATSPSGKQFTLQAGSQTAVITEVGAGLRSYSVDGRELLDGYAADQMCSDARGQTFIPWPNRIADGAYTFEGRSQQLPLTEPGAHNAIHGLTRWGTWRLRHGTQQSVQLQHDLHPQPGYPFALRCQVTYRLTATGLSVETHVTNVGPTACPYATGAHPYVALGTELIDELTVQVPAAVWFPTDDRGIPVGRKAVDGTDHDLRSPTVLGARVLDSAFSDLVRNDEQITTVTVRSPDGQQLSVWMDEAYRYVELFTGDSLPDADRRRRGLGIEPMTAAPNAFQTGDGLLVLQPDESHTATWGLRRQAPSA